MEENKNQTNGIIGKPDNIFVKDYDGRFKILSDGELKELDSLLASTESPVIRSQPGMTPVVSTELSFPKFTDIAPVPEDAHFRESEPAKASGTVSELHFHPDDKAEVAKELEKINALFKLEPQKKYSVVKIAEKLLEKHNIALSREDRQAVMNAILSYFRQLRSLTQTKDELTRPKEQGGVGIAEGTVDHMLAIAKVLKQKIEDNDGIVVDEAEKQAAPVMDSIKTMQPEPARPVSAAMPEVTVSAPLRPASEPVMQVSAPSQLSPAAPQDAPSPSLRPSMRPHTPPSMRPVLPRSNETEISKPLFHETVVQAPIASAPPVVETSPIADMPRVVRPLQGLKASNIQDVRRPFTRPNEGKLMGRVDELATMDLATWRMLDADPRIRAGKILGKIQNLEQESLTRKSQGIEAWRSNEVYQRYLMLGQLSLEQKKDIAEVIKNTESRGEHTLSLEEFEAVSDLNRMLRF